MTESEIFNAAVKLSTDQRAAFLDQACADNPAARKEIESLLCAHEAPSSFLEGQGRGLPPAAGGMGIMAARSGQEQAGTRARTGRSRGNIMPAKARIQYTPACLLATGLPAGACPRGGGDGR